MYSGWGSQWYSSRFTSKLTIAATKEGDKGEQSIAEELATFPTAEHWMMVQKALLFQDADVARQIMAVTGTGSADMAFIKSLGRKVRGFDEATWVAKREAIVLEGNLLKFRQNPGLKAKLLETGEKKLVEASPRDRIWGVGFGEKNALSQRDRWGLNLLGKALEETRRILREEAKSGQSQAIE
ncbi:hypothetical protein M413DRAFT_70694 [Hebeloma cylindrosporum]|uniref:NADAR domain-containing protein n=1 Tax=Hebeloma cylindrosporum TaxID=76867 RepID=A0A0C3CD19_HEBCY|nr:hypothetical protein M413DRAFT_70694 [Hebeloma cylindrosporum h7]